MYKKNVSRSVYPPIMSKILLAVDNKFHGSFHDISGPYITHQSVKI